jgi:hypothetical protein
VLRHAGLAEPQPLYELVHRPLALAQELEDQAPRRVGQGAEGGGGGGRAHEGIYYQMVIYPP